MRITACFKASFTSSSNRTLFSVYLIFLSLYLSFVTYIPRSHLFAEQGRIVLKLAFFVLLTAAFAAVLILLCCVSISHTKKQTAAKGNGVSEKWFFCAVFAVTMAILLITLASCKPGAVNYDVSNQWQQAQTGEYNNWHPVFHTLWIWLVTRISHNYSIAIAIQLLLFSVAAARLAVLIKRNGIPGRIILLLVFFVVGSKSVRNTMMYLGKDAMMTILCTVSAGFLVEIYHTKGGWLTKPVHAILFGLCVTFISLIRQNALFFTIPLLLCLFFLFADYRKVFLTVFSSAVISLLVIKCVVYPCLDIIYPTNTVEESAGLPMTILADAYVSEPEKVDDEARQFLLTLASDAEWKTKYHLHQYNSIKFEFARELVQEKSLFDLFKYAWNTAKASPASAFESVLQVTGLVWNIDGENTGYQGISNSGTLRNVTAESGRIQSIGKSIISVLDRIYDFPPIAYFTQNIGVEMLILLLSGLFALRKKGNAALLFVLPIACYNLGTMLLLCGNDARFFQFSMFLCYPFSLLLLYPKKGEEPKAQ